VVDAVGQGLADIQGDARHVGQPSPDPFDHLLAGEVALRFEGQQNVRNGYWRRVLIMLPPAGVAAHRGDPRHAHQPFFQFAGHPVRLVQRGSRRHETHHQRRPLVEGGQELRAQGEEPGAGTESQDGEEDDHQAPPTHRRADQTAGSALQQPQGMGPFRLSKCGLVGHPAEEKQGEHRGDGE